MQNLKISEVNSNWVNDRINDGTFYNTDNSVLQQISHSWASSDMDVAQNLSREIIDLIFPNYYGSGIWINDELIYSNEIDANNRVTSGKNIISGIDKDRPITGFVARAYATNIKSRTEKIIGISPKGSGWRGGELILTKHFDLNSVDVEDAELILSIHSRQLNDDVLVDFNNGQCNFNRNQFTWDYGMSEANVGYRNVASCVNSGKNTLQIKLLLPDYNSHTHPGLILKLNLSEDVNLEIQEAEVSERIYFSDIHSIEHLNWGAGVWGTLPFYIPDDAIDPKIRIQIAARNVRATTGFGTFSSWSGIRQRRNHDYIFFLNDQNPIHTIGNPSLNPTFNYDSDFLAPHIVRGTNTISVYINCFGDTVWGWGWSKLYSDPFNDPDGSSFVEVNYTLPSTIPYGLIDVGRFEKFPPPDLRDKTVSFSYAPEAVMKGNTFVHLTQRFSNSINIWAGTTTPPGNHVYETPSVRAVPTSVHMHESHFDLEKQNYVRIRESVDVGVFSSNHSYLEHHFYIPSFVSYEGVFPTNQEAIDDALQRLDVVIGNFLDIDGIVTSSDSISEVPSMWGPLILEVRMWN